MRKLWSALSACALALALGAGGTGAQETPPAAEPEWEWSASGFWDMPPDDENFLLPIVTATRDRLYLEARYNYEDRETGSLFGGWIFTTGSTVEFEAIPMLGAVVGRTDGIAPAFTFTLTWRSLSLYSENEYVYVPSDSEGSFFYNWSELSWDPLDWLGGGIVTQRTRVYDADRDIQRGVFARVSWGKLNGTGYWFNPGSDDAFGIVSFGMEF